MRDYRRLTTSPWRQQSSEEAVPRVEQSYKTLYPKLDVSDLLEVAYARPSRASSSAAPSGRQAPAGRKLLDSETSKDNHHKEIASQLFKATPALQNAGYGLPFTRPDTYLRNDPIASTVHPEELLGQDERAEPGKYDDLQYVDYDMDEQDAAVMGHLIAKYQAPLTAELFEAAMSMLELEAFKLQLKISTSGKAPRHLTDETSQCVVCCETECENGNEIVFCDGCNIAVHQDCYGVPFIPEGGWFCRKCQLAREQSVKCLFCPHTAGAFKLTDAGHWTHTVCALWIPELYFLNSAYMEPVAGIQSIPKSRWRLTCSICQQRGGASIQCAHKSCCQAFHVTCAQAAGQYMAMTGGVSAAINDPSTMIVYCHKHTPREANLMVDVETARQVLNLQGGRMAKKGGKRVHPFWRTTSGVFVVPKLVSDAVSRNILDRFSVDLSNVMPQLCRYWTLKQDRMGTLLNKRLKRTLDIAQYNFSSADERTSDLAKHVKELGSLINIVEKVKEVCASSAPAAIAEPSVEPPAESPSVHTVPATPAGSTPGDESDSSIDEPVTDSEAVFEAPKPSKKVEFAKKEPEIETPRRRLRFAPKNESQEPKLELGAPAKNVAKAAKAAKEVPKVEATEPLALTRRLRSRDPAPAYAPASAAKSAAKSAPKVSKADKTVMATKQVAQPVVSPRRTRSSVEAPPSPPRRQLRPRTIMKEPEPVKAAKVTKAPPSPKKPVPKPASKPVSEPVSKPVAESSLKTKEAKPTAGDKRMSKLERALKEKARLAQRTIDRRIQRQKEREQKGRQEQEQEQQAAEKAQKDTMAATKKTLKRDSNVEPRPAKRQRVEPPISRLRRTRTCSYVF